MRRQVLELGRPHEHVVGNVHVAEVARDVDVLAHRAPHDADLPANGDRDVDRLLHAVHVGCKRGHEHAALPQRNDLTKRLADDAFRLRHPRPFGVRRVAEHEVDALVAELRQSSDVRLQPVDGGVVDLVVARVHDPTGRRLEHHSNAVRNRMRHPHERDAEGADLARGVVGVDLAQLGRAQQPVLVELRLHEPEGQACRPDLRDPYLAQEIRQRADVIFVPVREDQRADVCGAFAEIGEVRQDEIDAQMLVSRKRQAGVDDDEGAVTLVDGQVLADLSQAAERHDPAGLHDFSV